MFGEIIALVLAGVQTGTAPQQEGAGSPEEASHLQIVAETPIVKPEYWAQQCKPWDEWEKPGPPFRIYGNSFYVGTCGIAVLLVRGEHGLVMIDTGTEKGMWLAMQNVARIGYDPSLIGLLLYSHEHFDHVGGMAAAQIYTGAPVLALAGAAKVLSSGQDDIRDPQAGMHEPMKPAPHVIEFDTSKSVTYGGVAFTPIATPGHTPSALSWQWESCEGEVCKTIVYADSLSPVSSDDYRFSDHPEYLAEYRAGIDRLRGLKCDILLTPHPSASRMIERAATGTLEDGMNCADYADAISARLDARLAKEAEGQ